MDTKAPRHSRFKHRLCIALTALLILSLSSTTAWLYWQNQQLTQARQTLQGDKSRLEQQIADLTSQKQALSNTNNELEHTIETLRQPARVVPVASVQSSQHFGGGVYFYDNDANDFLLVNVTLKNTGSDSSTVNPSDFKLKDSDSHAYPLYQSSAVGGQPRFVTGVELLPPGIVELRFQTIESNETVKGTLIFYVPKTLKQATLTYNSQTFTVKP